MSTILGVKASRQFPVMTSRLATYQRTEKQKLNNTEISSFVTI